MSVARSCLQCRAAKVKCDRAQPSCGRCARRGLACSGSATDSDLIWRDERAVAQRNSRRARGESSHAPVLLEAFATPSRSGSEEPDLTLDRQYPWLNDQALATLPEPLKRDSEARAVDRLFLDWILYPGRDGVPGFMHNIPRLYYTASPGSPIWHAVRAVAFADVGRARTRTGGSFSVKARRSYGEALSQMRIAAGNAHEFTSDQIFASLLLMDYFEAMYLAHNQPLGPHSDAIKYVMSARGNDQVFDSTSYALWREANCRLQARQIQTGEEPDASQAEVLSKLNQERPDIHIITDILHMTSLNAKAGRLRNDPSPGDEGITQLVNSMQDLTTSMEAWTLTLTGAWAPQVLDSVQTLELNKMDYGPDHPLTYFYCTELFYYSDVWFGYIRNFHSASQILCREQFINVLKYRARLQGQEDDESDQIKREQIAIQALSTSIIQSFPQFLGLIDETGQRRAPLMQGKVASRFLALFALDVIQRAEHTPAVHKTTASKVLQWIFARHSLE